MVVLPTLQPAPLPSLPMKVIIRNPQRRELVLEGSRRVDALIKELGLNPEQVLVVRGGALLTRDVMVRDSETVEIVSAISGGSGEM